MIEPIPVIREAFHSRTGSPDRRQFYVMSEIGVDPRDVLIGDIPWGSRHPWESSLGLYQLTIKERLTPTVWRLDAMYSPHIALGQLAPFDKHPSWKQPFPLWQCVWKSAVFLAVLQLGMWIAQTL